MLPSSLRSQGTLRNCGMTLLECMCSVAVLAVLVSVLSQTFISTSRLSAASNRALDRVGQAAEIRDAFTAAVREAGRVADGVLEFKTGGDCLVLELPPAPAAPPGAMPCCGGSKPGSLSGSTSRKVTAPLRQPI